MLFSTINRNGGEIEMRIIEIRNLKKVFLKKDKVEVIKDISFKVEKGSIVSIVGVSGCGKTTLLKLIAGLIEPTVGEIIINDTDTKRDIGFVFQNPALLPWRTVYKNVLLSLEISSYYKKKDKREKKEIVDDMINLVGLSDFKNSLPHQLSGGMQQRVSIARALAPNPKLLLMDEPFGSLDEFTRDRLNDELLRIWYNLKPTIIFITHSLREAVYLSQKIIVLSERPAVIKKSFDVGLPYPRNFDVRSSERFRDLLKEIRLLLDGGDSFLNNKV